MTKRPMVIDDSPAVFVSEGHTLCPSDTVIMTGIRPHKRWWQFWKRQPRFRVDSVFKSSFTIEGADK